MPSRALQLGLVLAGGAVCITEASSSLDKLRGMMSLGKVFNGELLRQLDAAGQMVGTGNFDRSQYDDMVSCMNERAPGLLDAQNSAWEGFVRYFDLNPADDRWGSRDQTYQENNKTALPFPSGTPVDIYEPCNYVSNFAYYRVVAEICNHDAWNLNDSELTGLVQTFSNLAWGSSFWHGSWTRLGNYADNRFIDVLAFIPYQASVANLPCTERSCLILRGLSTTPRRATGVEVSQELTDLLSNEPAERWEVQMRDIMADMPDYEYTFAAIVAHWLNLVLPPDDVGFILDFLADLLGLGPEIVDFLNNVYLPALREATADIELTEQEKENLLTLGAGAGIKLIYAFLWQEERIRDPILLDPEVNVLGADAMPLVNLISNILTKFQHYDPTVQNCQNVYPGDERCRKEQPHSKWHEMSANGLLDIVLAGDEIARITEMALKRSAEEARAAQAASAATRAPAAKWGVSPKASAEDPELLKQFDAVGELTGVGSYDRRIYEEIVTCMDERAPRLFDTQNAAWVGFRRYFESNGAPGDPWGKIPDYYQEDNRTALPPPSDTPVDIFEPCNYASNFAYYRVLPEICNHEGWGFTEREQSALIQTFANLAWGSSFWHGSWTDLGQLVDNRLIDIIALIPYQASVANIPCRTEQECNVLRGLSETTRRATGVEVAEELTNLFGTTRAELWFDGVSDIIADTPDYYLTFAAIVANWLNLILPPEDVDAIIDFLVGLLGLPEDILEFVEKVYLPTLRQATAGIELTDAEKERIFSVGAGGGIKLLYAFLWQERVISDPIFLDPGLNQWGADIAPSVNALANELTGFDYYDQSVQDCQNVYPGDQRCRVEQPHSKWHEMSALGLFDILLSSDEVAKITAQKVAELQAREAATTASQ